MILSYPILFLIQANPSQSKITQDDLDMTTHRNRSLAPQRSKQLSSRAGVHAFEPCQQDQSRIIRFCTNRRIWITAIKNISVFHQILEVLRPRELENILVLVDSVECERRTGNLREFLDVEGPHSDHPVVCKAQREGLGHGVN